jgi:hypothetical protein
MVPEKTEPAQVLQDHQASARRPGVYGGGVCENQRERCEKMMMLMMMIIIIILTLVYIIIYINWFIKP